MYMYIMVLHIYCSFFTFVHVHGVVHVQYILYSVYVHLHTSVYMYVVDIVEFLLYFLCIYRMHLLKRLILLKRYYRIVCIPQEMILK